MRIDLHATQDVDGGLRETHVSETEVEYLADYAELILQFTRAIGYTYVNQVIFSRDDGGFVGTVR